MSGNKPFGESKYILFMLGILLKFSLSWFGDCYSEYVDEIISEEYMENPYLVSVISYHGLDSSLVIISVGSMTTTAFLAQIQIHTK